MKRKCLTAALLLYAGLLFSQTNVKINIERSEKIIGAIANIVVSVDGEEIGKLKNGGSLTWETEWPADSLLLIKVVSGINRREMTVKILENECFLETGLAGAGIFLNMKSGVSIAEGKSGYSGAKLGKKDGSISYTAVTTLESDTIRKAWIEKGGKILSRSVGLAVSLTSYKADGISMKGGGFSENYSVTYLNFNVPKQEPGRQKWNSFIYGYAYSAAIYANNTTVEMPPLEPMTFETMSMSMLLSINTGYTYGIGKFKTENKWKGVAFDFTYRPSIGLNYSEGDGNFSFNPLGLGLDINFNSFSSNAAKLAPKAQSKFSFFMLPPLGDKPFFVTFGYGLTWYRKR